MKKFRDLFFIRSIFLLIAGISFSCMPPEKFKISASGDMVELKLYGRPSLASELIVVTDSSFITLSGPHEIKIIEYSLDEIKSIKVLGYDSNSWVAPVLFGQVLPAVLLAVAASSAGAESRQCTSDQLNSGGSNNSIFLSSTNAPSFSGPYEKENLAKISMYSRFPQGLSKSQLESFKRINTREKFTE